jgi:hypothetical protein
MIPSFDGKRAYPFCKRMSRVKLGIRLDWSISRMKQKIFMLHLDKGGLKNGKSCRIF